MVFEGTQGIMLDIDHGTYPFVTSSNTVAGQAAKRFRLSPSSVDFVLGITKAYTTRVDLALFQPKILARMATEWENVVENSAAVTGEKTLQLVRCGDGKASGLDEHHRYNMTKLDMLDGFDVLRICVGYECNGQRLDIFPANAAEQATCTHL